MPLKATVHCLLRQLHKYRPAKKRKVPDIASGMFILTNALVEELVESGPEAMELDSAKSGVKTADASKRFCEVANHAKVESAKTTKVPIT